MSAATDLVVLTSAVVLMLAFSTGCPARGGDRSVRDFGAIPDDGKDDTEAIRAAVAACESGDRLVFEEGVYDLTGTVSISGKDGLEIAGNGSEWVMRGYDRETGRGGFQLLAVADSRNINLHDFSVDQFPSRHMEGKILQVGDGFIDLRILDDYLPITGRERIDIMMDYLPGGIPNGREFNTGEYERTELVAPDVLRIYTKHASLVRAGDFIVIRHEAYGPNVMSFGYCENVTLRDVSFYAGGMGITAYRTTGITLERFAITYRPGTERMMSANADGLHFNMCRGRITIKDSTLLGMGDDCINIHGMWTRVVAVDRQANTVRLESGKVKSNAPPGPLIYSDWALAGDELAFYDTDLRPKGTASVVAAVHEDNNVVVTLDTVPEDIMPDDLVDNATWTPSVRLTGSRLGYNRARGFLCQVPDVVAEGNTFSHVSSGAIWIMTDTHFWFESGPANNIVFRDNVVEGCNKGETFRGGAVIVFNETGWDRYGPAGALRNITIEGNTIRDTDASGIWVASGEHVRILGNHIEDCSKEPQGLSDPDSGQYAIYLLNTDHALVAGNTFSGIRSPIGQKNCRDVTYIAGARCEEEPLPE